MVVPSVAAFLVDPTVYNVVRVLCGLREVNLARIPSRPQDATSPPSSIITSMAPASARGVPATKDAENTPVNAPSWDTPPTHFHSTT